RWRASLNGGATGPGNSTATFDTITVFAPPAAPTGLTASAMSSSQIALAWNAYTGASSYKIQRSADGTTWTQVGTATATSYQDAGLAASTTYLYRIAAVTAAADSLFSATASATTSAANGGVLFSDNFNGTSLNSAW